MEISRNRKLKSRIGHLCARATFNLAHISFPQRVCAVAILLLILSLVFPWASLPLPGDTDATVLTAFSSLSGYIGILLLFVIALEVILLASHTHKERLKSRILLMLPDHNITLFSGILITFLTFSIAIVLASLDRFSMDAQILRGPIFALMGGILLISSAILTYRGEKKESIKTLYVENQPSAELLEYQKMLSQSPEPDDKNMSLPV